ncbi:MAG: DEAD/DEAH box helicase family protein [Cohaesibacter sp.]|jgi:predicted helicase|nr:DEAD/DEAH box helicase family protein [Cohaesibacter sp.]
MLLSHIDDPSLYQFLETYAQTVANQRDKGTMFEKAVALFLIHDAVQQQFYDEVKPYASWAQEQEQSGTDHGIDLVARLRDGSGYAAIQCKFYKADHRIQKADIDSFLAASGKSLFVERIFFDTTKGSFGKLAEAQIAGQTIPFRRIGLEAMEQSRIKWASYFRDDRLDYIEQKSLRPHQKDALNAVKKGLSSADRGKLIMACGTGKTFTALKIAEDMVGRGKRVLFMVPSLALMSQTVTEWKNDAERPFQAFAVCSDNKVGKRSASDDDLIEIARHDLAFPATTDARRLAKEYKTAQTSGEMIVVFSTYQSIEVISKAQQSFGMDDFDLIICDEAHRTTGYAEKKSDASLFMRIHDQAYVKGNKRIYMTATPRIFAEDAQKQARQAEGLLCSMDDESVFGKELFFRGFSWAVGQGLLSDYKVLVLAVDEDLVSHAMQSRLSTGSELDLDDATRIIGCYKALTKERLKEDLAGDTGPMRRALAFCKDIKTSKRIAKDFGQFVSDYLAAVKEEQNEGEGVDGDSSLPALECELNHVDGTFNAKQRGELLRWLKEEPEKGEGAQDKPISRILTNARCLSEGVDVPALDAIMFLHPRKSQIDVVQSVGRVMRRAPGKEMGYVIIPVGIPSGIKPEEALNDNERYKVIWQILNALRAHDERFDAMINRAGLEEDVSDKIEIIGVSRQEKEATTAVVEELPKRRAQTKPTGMGRDMASETRSIHPSEIQLPFIFDDVTKAIMARIVKKCGTRDYWENWATDIAHIAQKHIARITAAISIKDSKAQSSFSRFLLEIRDDLNPNVSQDEAVEMLAQHLITRPVFETLFQGHEFARDNPVSKAMEQVLGDLQQGDLETENARLEKFYDSVKMRADGIETAHGRQQLILKLYDTFFSKAFPKMQQQLGIVYTPVEVVDFIIHSVNDVLKDQFGQTLGSRGVHILDPFTGTGTFITRLLQSGLIKPEELEHKYRYEIHANEIVLLAYYIAAINIEAVYHDLSKDPVTGERKTYHPYEGICLTDTFQMYEQERDMVADLLPDNSERRTRQKQLDIQVIIGNPPYSAGQRSANDNAANLSYPNLDEAIRKSYAAHSGATNKNALYDSYIRAIRWATDRITEKGDDRGIVAYVSNAGWIDGNATAGLRKCLKEEFSNLYIFHLRGNARTSGEQRRKEKGNVFGEGTRTPIAISILVRNPQAKHQGQIYFHDIGDYLSREDKLNTIKTLKSINGISDSDSWTPINPDENHDWLNQSDKSFGKYLVLGNKKDKQAVSIFSNYSNGIKTNSDTWMYNSSVKSLGANMAKMTSFYNSEVDRYQKHGNDLPIDQFVSFDPAKISWHSSSLPKASKGIKASFNSSRILIGLYRPFQKQQLYYDSHFIQRRAQIPQIFPHASAENLVIQIAGVGGRAFSALMSKCIPDIQAMFNGQCFPLYLYEKEEDGEGLFASNETGYRRVSGISDEGLAHFRAAYPDEEIEKEDLFYYIYGLLHSPHYRKRFKNNLSKELPRIPPVKKSKDFWAFAEAGRKLGALHVDFEKADLYPVTFKEGARETWVYDDEEAFFRVEKMKQPGTAKTKDRSEVIYNSNITITNIPLEAYGYVINGKPALDWVMERQCVKTDKASGIVNDANLYATETMNNPAYPLELFQRVITVSLETMAIVRALPKLDID